MSDPLHSFEPLVPVPFKQNPSPRPNTPKAAPDSKPIVGPSTEEADIDKFATLFNPLTPPATPTLPPIFAQPRPTSTIRSHSTHRLSQTQFGPIRQDSSNEDSEFGAFVSVPPSEDPLSQLFFETPSSESTLSGSHTGRPRIENVASNASLDFFGQFVEGAKEQESRGRGKTYLDELLRHENDPFNWIKDAGEDPTVERSSGGGQDESRSVHDSISNTISEHGLEVSLLDLDLDNDAHFSRNGAENVVSIPPSDPAPAQSKSKLKPFATPSLSPTFPFTARPPLSSHPSYSNTPSVSHLSHSNDSISVPQPSSSPPIPTSSPRPAFSTQPSRWVSSLLSTPRTSVDEQSHPSVQGIFPALHARSSSTDALQHQIRHPSPHPQQQYSLPTSVSASSTISHGTPFASRSYIPPSGAPGFTGSDALWDKGFSDDFEKDGKKTKGHIRLEGRREATDVVLEMNIVDLIRPHFPALARLPRKWMLLYSLDQHGISLNTLYTRCEPQGPSTSHPQGSLVVMKDSGDTIFGAYIGEGVRVSKGYYGSGESFLWRYAQGTLDVFKWTGKNEYVAHCEPEYLSFGGGDGQYGLYLDDSLLEGSSAQCPTFANEPLCSPGVMKGGNVAFECVGLEVWAVGPS